MFDFEGPWIFYLCILGATYAIADVIYSLAFTSQMYRKEMNRRLAQLEKNPDRIQALGDLRRERGLSLDGGYLLPVIWINRLIVQSGTTIKWPGLVGIAAGAGLSAWALGYWLGYPFWSAVGGVAAFILSPLVFLHVLRRRRQKKFTEQFSEAIDIIVRSLKAGHPVPTALKLAAREMPDPIGSEFGMVEDELTFGLDLETAMRNMQERVGQEDIPLFVASVSIQASSGGNLSEILQNLSNVLRQRIKLRRKIRALSAEGRISALILSAVPIALFMIINLIAPQFYSQNWNHPWMLPGLGGAAVWMTIGNLWMRKMINFRI